MKTNDRGIELLKSFEGCRLRAYPDPGTGGAPWTIGYGHTGSDVYSTLVITAQKAEYLLRCDLKRFEDGVEKLLKTPVSDNQFSALVCFAYNVGLTALGRSKLLIKLNAGDSEGAADEFLKWVTASGHELAGLVKRRNAERELFLS